MIDISFQLQDHPGTLAALTDILAKANVNLEGGCGITCEGVGIIHFLVRNPEIVRKVFKEHDISILAEREVLIIDIEDQPGAAAQVLQILAKAEINVDLFYLTTKFKIIIGVFTF